MAAKCGDPMRMEMCRDLLKCLPFQRMCLTIAHKLSKKPSWTRSATVGVVKEDL